MYDDEDDLRQQLAQTQQALGVLVQREQAREFVNNLRASEQGFHSKNEKYYDALSHMRGQLTEKLTGLGYTDDQAQQQVNAWETQSAIQAMQNGRDPAQEMYNVATQNYGYDPEPKQTYTDPETDDYDAFEAARSELGWERDNNLPEPEPKSAEDNHLDTIVD